MYVKRTIVLIIVIYENYISVFSQIAQNDCVLGLLKFIKRTKLMSMLKQQNIIDGLGVSKIIKSDLKQNIEDLKTKFNTETQPGLAVVIVGDRKDSQTYVRMKKRAAENLGIYFELHKHSTDITEKELLYEIGTLNHDNRIHGIIVQLPLPDHINERNIISKVSITKDVDGFHGLNMGNLALEGCEPYFSPCTPRGVMELLDYYQVPISGKHFVILGKSNIVGLPMSLMLLNKNATVTICNSETEKEEEITRNADVLISAVGIPQLVKEDWVKEGVVVIDIGINSVPDSTKKRGYRLVGDVDFENVGKKAKLITPVPGGVGPMTVAMLMKATVESFERHLMFPRIESRLESKI